MYIRKKISDKEEYIAINGDRIVLTDEELEENGIEKIDELEVFASFKRTSCNEFYISQFGRTLKKNRKSGEITVKNQCLNKKDEKGYYRMIICEKGYNLNRVVAELFCYNPYQKEYYNLDELQAHHKDGVRSNNRHDNLMWVSCIKGIEDHHHGFVHRIKGIGIYDGKNDVFIEYDDMERALIDLGLTVRSACEWIELEKKPLMTLKRDGREWSIYAPLPQHEPKDKDKPFFSRLMAIEWKKKKKKKKKNK